MRDKYSRRMRFAAEGTVIYTALSFSRKNFAQERHRSCLNAHSSPTAAAAPRRMASASGCAPRAGRQGAGAAPRQGTQARLREARFSRVVALTMAPPKLSSGIPGSGVSARSSREARLRKHADFDTVYRNGRRLFSAHLTVFFLPRDAAGGARGVHCSTGAGRGGGAEPHPASDARGRTLEP